MDVVAKSMATSPMTPSAAEANFQLRHGNV
jgi:hypothetical protein